jgi:hypothetical protein
MTTNLKPRKFAPPVKRENNHMSAPDLHQKVTGEVNLMNTPHNIIKLVM